MQKTLAALSIAAGIGFVCCQTAGAVPASAPALKEAATGPHWPSRRNMPSVSPGMASSSATAKQSSALTAATDTVGG